MPSSFLVQVGSLILERVAVMELSSALGNSNGEYAGYVRDVAFPAL